MSESTGLSEGLSHGMVLLWDGGSAVAWELCGEGSAGQAEAPWDRRSWAWKPW